MNVPVSAIGVPWYSLEDYAEIKSMMEDGHKLPPTYTQWRFAAEQLENQMRRGGERVVRAHLDPVAFREFCAANGHRLDAQGRSKFAAAVAVQQHGTRH